MRINKFIAQSGAASRRKADELILAGKVTVNGAVLKEPGYDVVDGDRVVLEGRLIKGPEAHVYYALNKPVGFITTTSDEQGRPTVMSLLSDVTARVYPVGRLDCMTSGLLLLTNDGALSQHLAHPSNKVYKTYKALISGYLSREELALLRGGVRIEGRLTAPAKVEPLKRIGSQSLVEIKICEGRNRQVRKMFEAAGHRVLELQRTAVGNVQLGHLLEGHYRRLSAAETEYLKNC